MLCIVAALLPRQPLEKPLAPPPAWFNDNAGLVSSDLVARMNQRLPIERHAQIVVAIDSNAPPDLEAFTARAAQDWYVGNKRADNGLVVFVFPSVRTVRVEIGYGLEGALPDVDARRMLDAQLLPAFANGRYDDGIEDFLEALFKWFEDDRHQAKLHALDVGFVDSVVATARQVPPFLRAAWNYFAAASLQERLIMALFATVSISILAELAMGGLLAIVAIAQIPWRLTHSATVGALDRDRLAQEFSAREFVRRPPPSIVAISDELELPVIGYGFMCVCGILVAMVFLASGTNLLIGARGQFGGAGVTLVWPG